MKQIILINKTQGINSKSSNYALRKMQGIHSKLNYAWKKSMYTFKNQIMHE